MLILRLKKCRISRALREVKDKDNHHNKVPKCKYRWFRKTIYKLTQQDRLLCRQETRLADRHARDWKTG